GAAPQIAEDLRLLVKRPRPGRMWLERVRVELGWDVTGAARIVIVPPGSADLVSALQDRERLDPRFSELDSHAQPGEAGADDQHLIQWLMLPTVLLPTVLLPTVLLPTVLLPTVLLPTVLLPTVTAATLDNGIAVSLARSTGAAGRARPARVGRAAPPRLPCEDTSLPTHGQSDRAKIHLPWDTRSVARSPAARRCIRWRRPVALASARQTPDAK